jgi:hypothetical protein
VRDVNTLWIGAFYERGSVRNCEDEYKDGDRDKGEHLVNRAAEDKTIAPPLYVISP